MEFKDALEYVSQCVLEAEGRHLSPVETEILRGAWEKLTYDQMAAQVDYSPNTLQKVYGYRLWKLLRRLWPGSAVSKSRFKEVVTERLQKQQTQLGALSFYPDRFDSTSSAYQFDRLGGLDISPPSFICRDRTLQDLIHHIQAGCRLVVLTGASGIGKTVLLGQLVRALSGKFEDILYRRADDVPTLMDWYRDFATLWAQEDPTEFPEDEAACLRLALKELHRRRYLLVIDQTEKNSPLGITDNALGSSGYAQLLKRISQEPHHSCLVWVGQTRPDRISAARGRVLVKSLLSLEFAEAKALILEHHALEGSLPDWQQLVALCGGTPSLLVEISTHIAEMHGSKISAFLETPLPLPRSLTAMLSETIEALSAAEIALLYLLALHPIEMAQLEIWRQSLPFSDLQLRQAWESLQHRHWLKSHGSAPSMVSPPLSSLYILHRLADAFSQDIIQETLDIAYCYPVQVVTAPFEQQDYLRRFLINPITDAILQACHGSAELLQAKFSRLLEQLRHFPGSAQSYMAGNLLNLSSNLNLSLAGLDFSGLDIRHADLQNTDLRGVQFINCKFHDTILASGLCHDMIAALNPEAQYLAIGDSAGRLNIYQQRQGRFWLLWSHCFEHAVQAIAFEQTGHLAVATAAQSVFVWWAVETKHPPDYQVMVDARIRTLCISPKATYLAIGLTDGRLIIHDLWKEQLISELSLPTGVAAHLAFSPDGRSLASYSGDNQVLIWHIDTCDPVQGPVQGIELGAHGDGVFLALSWDHQQPLVLERAQAKTWLRISSDQAHLLVEQGDAPYAATISSNGEYVATSSSDGRITIWQRQSQDVLAMINTGSLPGSLEVSHDGSWLLHRTPAQIKLYKITSGQCFQVFTPTLDQNLYEGCQLMQSSGLPSAAQSIAQALGADI